MTAIAELFGAGGPLQRTLDGYAPRSEQIAMAEAVARALASRDQLVVEAGTGTGKTFAYLVPALLSAGRVIVSTGTRTLQDQLYHRDLPLLARSLGRPLRIALLKGRSNYLCRHRLSLARGAELPGLGRHQSRALTRIESWAATTRHGDIGELESVPENEPVWAAVTSTRDNCLGQSCPEFRDCHVVQARREAQAAELVIVNHHLLLADLTLKEEGFGELLPGADAVILDEAHQFPDVAAQFFRLTVSARAVSALAEDALAELARAGLLDAGARADVERLGALIARLGASLGGLPSPIAWLDVPEPFLEGLTELGSALDTLGERLDHEDLEVAAVRAVGRRARELALKLGEFESLSDDAGLRVVEVTTRGFALEFTPFEVATRLKAHVAARPCAWIHTSATLAVGDDFTHYTERVGADQATKLKIASPFDYQRNARLYLPRGLPEPSVPGYSAAVVDAALPVVRAAGGRAFLLFTSHRGLGEGAQRLREAMSGEDAFPVLVQGEAPRDALLRRFRELGNAVLLGTGSFWEGVDVRGAALSVVVIDKLPFAAPDDPLLKARLEGLRRAGKNGFMHYQLPQAVLALKQGVGRLIRATDDTGVIMLCDPRLTSKGYGRTFLSSLPDMPRTRDVAEVVAFLESHLGPARERRSAP